MESHGEDDSIRAHRPQRDFLADLAGEFWERPELALHEHQSATLLYEELNMAGFDVKLNIGGMPSAFVARYGSLPAVTACSQMNATANSDTPT
jgi:metal-dependent amidase/aminoacylase/carboxypeptidase family protein